MHKTTTIQLHSKAILYMTESTKIKPFMPSMHLSNVQVALDIYVERYSACSHPIFSGNTNPDYA